MQDVLLATEVQKTIVAFADQQNLLINAFDRDYRILYWNARCVHYFGIAPGLALGQKLTDLLPLSIDDERYRLVQRAFDGFQITLLRQAYQRSTGFYDQQLIPVRNDAGSVIAVVNVVSDC